jgi:hypothetical protein
MVDQVIWLDDADGWQDQVVITANFADHFWMDWDIDNLHGYFVASKLYWI